MSALVFFLEKNQEWRIYLMYHAFHQALSMVSVCNKVLSVLLILSMKIT